MSLTGRFAPPLLQDCSFDIERSKETTGRVVVCRELGIINSFTLESSFLGPSVGGRGGYHYNVRSYEQVGEAIGKAILRTFRGPPEGMDLSTVIKDLVSIAGFREGEEGRRRRGGVVSDGSNDLKEDHGSDTGDSDQEEEEEERDGHGLLRAMVGCPEQKKVRMIMRSISCVEKQARRAL